MTYTIRLAVVFTTLTATIPPTLANAAETRPLQGSSGLSSNPGVDSPDSVTVVGEPLPTSPPPMGGLFPQTGRDLLSRGIDFHGTIFEHFLANPSAGIQRGHTTNLGAFSPAVDVDLGMLAGLPGANIHFAISQYFLRSGIPEFITQAGGTLTGYQSTPQTPASEINVLTYEQKLLGGRLSIEVGRTNAYHYFFLPIGLDFLSSVSTTINVDGDFTAFPHASWGGRATYNLTPEWYVQAGAFEDNALRALNNPYVFGTHTAAGTQLILEAGQRTRFDTAAYPSSMEAGVMFNTRTGVNNLKGTALFNAPFTSPTPYKGGGALFIQGEKVVWRGAGGSPGLPPANIALYGSATAAFDKPQPIDMDAVAGVTFTGFIPGRPLDALGLQVHYQRLSAIEATFESNAQTIFAGPGRAQPRDGYQFEAIGNVQLTPWAALRPLVQYFHNPDAYFRPAQSQRPHDGIMAGVFGIVSLGPALGTSLKPF